MADEHGEYPFPVRSELQDRRAAKFGPSEIKPDHGEASDHVQLGPDGRTSEVDAEPPLVWNVPNPASDESAALDDARESQLQTENGSQLQAGLHGAVTAVAAGLETEQLVKQQKERGVELPENYEVVKPRSQDPGQEHDLLLDEPWLAVRNFLSLELHVGQTRLAAVFAAAAGVGLLAELRDAKHLI